MNSTDNRKSMDDVLASIRRIVRAEKEPDAGGPGPAEARPAPAAGQGPDRPLALTPDMRMDPGEVEPEAISRPAASALAGAAPAGAAMPDREALRQIVREVLLDELAKADAGQAVRGIIRDELINGEIGGNISQNVLRLIRDEVAKALDER